MKRCVDILLAILLIILLLPLCFIISGLIFFTSKGHILYWSKRIGRKNILFNMPKFRTMKVDTPTVATHLLNESQSYLTPVGSFLRKSSLDELPQLLSILKGEMSFVGPRPALYNQYDLQQMRTLKGIHLLKPGLTGYAQVMGRDELTLEEKVSYDLYYLNRRNFRFDCYLIFKTFLKVLKRDGIQH